MTESNEFRPDEDVRRVAPALHRVVVPTDADGDGMARARRAATQLASTHGWELVLYDRSNERWTDTPHPAGLVTADEIDRDERGHLARQMDDIEAAGVDVAAWLATVPALTAMIDVFQAADVDGVVVPDQLDSPKMMDRLQTGGSPDDLIARVAELQLDSSPAFLVVHESGKITLAADRGHTAASAEANTDERNHD